MLEIVRVLTASNIFEEKIHVKQQTFLCLPHSSFVRGSCRWSLSPKVRYELIIPGGVGWGVNGYHFTEDTPP